MHLSRGYAYSQEGTVSSTNRRASSVEGGATLWLTCVSGNAWVAESAAGNGMWTLS
jgi:hypothetical protein